MAEARVRQLTDRGALREIAMLESQDVQLDLPPIAANLCFYQ